MNLFEETAFGKHRRVEIKHQIPNSLKDLKNVIFETGKSTESINNPDKISRLFPNTYGQPIVNIIPKSSKSSDDIDSKEDYTGDGSNNTTLYSDLKQRTVS